MSNFQEGTIMVQVNAESVIKAYTKLREQRGILKSKYDDDDSVIKEKMNKLECWLLETMNQTGSTQLGSKFGTAYIGKSVKGSCADWPSLWNWVTENRRFDFIEKRISSKTVQEYYTETNELPPGVNIAVERKVIVRKS